MVAISYYENLERERREEEEARQEALARNRTAGNWLKGILGLATFNENVWRGATSGSTDKFLELSSQADPVELALGVATLVAFSYAGGLGTKLGRAAAKNPKGGRLITYDEVSQSARQNGYKINPDVKPKIQAEINRINNLGERQQLQGLQKIRTDTIEQATELLKKASPAEKPKLEQTIRETTAKYENGGKQIQVYDLNKADPYRQYKIENGKVVEDLQASVDNLNKLDPDIQFKVENGAIARIRKAADPEVVKRNEAITDANIEQVKQLYREAAEREARAKAAREKAKGEDKAIDEDPDFDEKGTPDGGLDEVIETKEKLKESDKPDFGDKAEGKEVEDIEETIGEKAESKAGSKEVDTTGKAAAAGAAAIIATEVVEKVTRGEDGETRRRRNFEEADEDVGKSGFTTEPVTTSEPKTTPATNTQGVGGERPPKGTFNYVNHKEKTTQTTENIDELFQVTIKVCTDVYDNRIGEIENYFYFESRNFDIPFLFYIQRRTLYIAFRGTASISNVITDLTTADISILKNFSNSNFLSSHHPFKDILPPKASRIEFHLGTILSLAKSYPFIIEQIKKAQNLVNSIVLCGHSLGGAAAQLFTYVYNNSYQDQDQDYRLPIRHLVTYGQPRILFDKPEYIQLFEESVTGYHRVWNTIDPIPYLPFRKQVFIDKMMSSNILSGYVHVGASFNLLSNIVNNDVDLLLYKILQGNKELIEQLLDKKDLLNNSKLLKFMLSDKYLALQLHSFIECLKNVEVKEEISEEQLVYLANELEKDTSKLLSYSEKCDLLKPWGLDEILKNNPIADDVDEENWCIEAIGGCSITSNKLSSEAHKLVYYHELLDNLINRQITEKKPIYEVVDEIDFKPRRIDMFDNVLGLVELGGRFPPDPLIVEF